MASGFIYVGAYVRIGFLIEAEKYSIAHKYYILLINILRTSTSKVLSQLLIDGDITLYGWKEGGVGSEFGLMQQTVVKCLQCAVPEQGSKRDLRKWGDPTFIRPRKDLPDKDLTRCTNKSPKVNRRIEKLSVLNLNETQLPISQDVGNMVVIWIPEPPEKPVRPAEKCIISGQEGRMNRAAKDYFLYGKQKTETQLGTPGMTVPPPSPVHLFEQLTSESIPFWNKFDVEPLPQDLLKALLPDEGKTVPSLEMKTQLAMMKKKLPLEKSRPDSAISAKMFLSVHRLTLQKPALRYPEHLKKLYSNLKTEGRSSGAVRSSGHKKQPRQKKQRMVKTPPKRQEAKEKPKSDPGNPDILRKHSGHKTLLEWTSDKKQPQQMKLEGPTLKQDSTERPQMKNYLDSFPSREDPELPKAKRSDKDVTTQEEVVPESQEKNPEDLPGGTSRTRWNPGLRLLRILQDTADEDEENRLSGSESEVSLETWQGSLAPGQGARNPEDGDLGPKGGKQRGLLLPGGFTSA